MTDIEAAAMWGTTYLWASGTKSIARLWPVATVIAASAEVLRQELQPFSIDESLASGRHLTSLSEVAEDHLRIECAVVP